MSNDFPNDPQSTRRQWLQGGGALAQIGRAHV